MFSISSSDEDNDTDSDDETTSSRDNDISEWLDHGNFANDEDEDEYSTYGGSEDAMQFYNIHNGRTPMFVRMTRVCAQELEDLRRVLVAATDFVAPIRMAKLCFLVLPKPSPTLLGKLIVACQRCTDNPGTLGWDLKRNQFCVLKTLRDVRHILDCLLDPTTPVAKTGTIRLINVDMKRFPVWKAF